MTSLAPISSENPSSMAQQNQRIRHSRDHAHRRLVYPHTLVPSDVGRINESCGLMKQCVQSRKNKIVCVDIRLECLSETSRALDVRHRYRLEFVRASSVGSKANGYPFSRSLGATDRTSCECPVRSKLVEHPGLVDVVNVGWVVIGEKLF